MLRERMDFNMFYEFTAEGRGNCLSSKVCVCLHRWLTPGVCWVSLLCQSTFSQVTLACSAFKVFPVSFCGSFLRP